MTTTTAPSGRLYWFGAKDDPTGRRPAEIVEWSLARYAATEGRPATWLRCHPSQEALFATIWPGAVVADGRVQRGTIMLGVEG